MRERTLNKSAFTGWPSGDNKPLILLRTTATDLSSKYGLVFFREKDDLDWGNWSHYIDEFIGPVVFVEYENAPVKGVDILVDKNVATALALNRVRESLGLVDSDIEWHADSSG